MIEYPVRRCGNCGLEEHGPPFKEIDYNGHWNVCKKCAPLEVWDVWVNHGDGWRKMLIGPVSKETAERWVKETEKYARCETARVGDEKKYHEENRQMEIKSVRRQIRDLKVRLAELEDE